MTDPDKPPRPSLKSALVNGRGVQLVAGLALIVALTTLIGGAYLWYALLFERKDLMATDVVGRLEKLTEDGAQMRETLGTLEQDGIELRETQDAFRHAIDRIQNDLTRQRSDWVLAETEQLLVTANHRLQLARDVGSALSALRAADRQINSLPNPGLLPVRKELVREIALLESLEKTDSAGMNLKLAQLAERVDRLPMVLEVKTAAPADKVATAAGTETSGLGKFSRELWQDLSTLVRVRTHKDPQRPLLPPEQHFFLRENLRLMLYGAQQALLQGQIPVYQQNLKTATQWVKTYFDNGSQVTLAMVSELEKLQSTRLTGELPNISTSLELLRRLNVKRETP
jgi:uncharacterized protein HemX